MTQLNFEKNEFNKLHKLNFKFKNAEADLYLYNDLIIKRFVNTTDIELKHKEDKIDYLMDIEEVDGLILPKYKLYIEGVFEGCASIYIKDASNFYEMYPLPLKDKIELYKRASQIIKNAHKKNIVIGDVSDNNMMYKDMDVYFCDTDSCSIGDIPSEVVHAFLFYNKNISYNITFSKKTDIFLLNMLFLNMLTKKDLSVISYKDFCKIVCKLNFSKEVLDYFLNIYDMDDKIYFDDIFKSVMMDNVKLKESIL